MQNTRRYAGQLTDSRSDSGLTESKMTLRTEPTSMTLITKEPLYAMSPPAMPTRHDRILEVHAAITPPYWLVEG
jgi:hypothetical protein